MALNFPNTPTDGQVYTDTNSGNRWVWDSANTAWKATSTFTQTITVSSSQPGSPVVGQLWWNQDYGRLFIYYNDGTSNQWVDATLSPDISGIYGVANAANLVASAAYNTANSGYVVANAAFGKANTALQNTSGTFAGNLQLTGNVGIGILPTSPLHILAPAGQLGVFSNNTSNVNSWVALSTGSASTTWGIDVDNVAYRYTPGAYKIFTGGANERLRISGAGDIGVGTTSMLSQFEVRKDSNAAEGATFALVNTGTGVNTKVSLYMVPNNGGGHDLQRASSIQSVQPVSGNYADLRFFTSAADTPAERMRIDYNGYVIKQNQPFARINSTAPVQSLTAGVQVVVAFNNIVEQTGSNYNTSNYRFTCPVAGKYLVTAAVEGNGLGANWYNLFIRVNGTNKLGTFMTGINVGYQPLYTYGIISCNASDYIDCAVTPNTTAGSLELNTSDTRNMFCVYLLG